MKKILYTGIGIFLALLAFVGFHVQKNAPATLGSIQDGQAYNSVSTFPAKFATTSLMKSGYGTLGSVVVTGAAAGSLYFYDATTTSILLRSADQSTSSITIAQFPLSTAAGTYTFDISFSRGLFYENFGTMPTTTITYR